MTALSLSEHLARIRAIKTKKRAEASRENGKLGGRPKNPRKKK